MLSVILPTYNRKELLKITLDNLFRQTRPADEVIVVDDHSSDGTYEYLKNELSDKVIALQTKGKGPGAARNTGLEVASGKFIKFFDSDDLMTLNALEVQSKLLEETKEPMVYSPYVQASFENEAWQQRDVVLQYQAIPAHKSLHSCMALGFFTVIPGMMFRKKFLEKVGNWRTDITAYEDWDFLWRIGELVANPLHTNECAMIYRVHGKQTTEANFTNTRRDQDKVKCLKGILSGKLSFQRRIWLNYELHKAEQLINGKKLIFHFTILDSFKRVRNKRERYLTQTNWERMHGPNADPKVFEHYVTLL